MRRFPALLAIIMSVCVLSACAGLPSTSSVAVGRAVTADETPDPLTVMPDGPLPSDDPRGIVTGFLRAQMWQPNGYSLARSFLTPSGSKQWHPGSTVTIFDDSSGLRVARPDLRTVRIHLPVVATLSADGHLSRSTTPVVRTLDFTIDKGASGWRLSRVPQGLGLWLARDDFDRLYQSVNVYYPSAFGHVMVPDGRWMRRQGLATALARATLSAPPRWLAPAVHVPFPSGTSLDVDSVPVSNNGHAVVDLSEQVQRASPKDRSAVWASAVATLVQAPDVHSVSVASSGARLETENLPSEVTSVTDVGYQMPNNPSSAAVARGGGFLSWTSPGALTAMAGETKEAATGRPRLPQLPPSWKLWAAGPGGRQIAAVSPDRTALRRWLNGTSVTLSNLGSNLVRPAFDAFGFLWSAGTATSSTHAGERSVGSSQELWALESGVTDEAKPPALAVPWLGSSRVEAVALSPEGERIAMVLSEGGRRRLVVAAVIRSSAGNPIGLGEPEDIPAVDAPTDVAWASAGELVSLANVHGTVRPVRVTLDGQVTPLAVLSGATSLVSTRSGEDGVFAITENDAVYALRGASWSRFVSGGSIAVPAS